MAKQNIILIETKIYDGSGEELAVSVQTIPLEDGECNICAAESQLAHLRINTTRLPVWHKKPSGKTVSCHGKVHRNY